MSFCGEMVALRVPMCLCEGRMVSANAREHVVQTHRKWQMIQPEWNRNSSEVAVHYLRIVRDEYTDGEGVADIPVAGTLRGRPSFGRCAGRSDPLSEVLDPLGRPTPRFSGLGAEDMGVGRRGCASSAFGRVEDGE